MDYNKLKNQMLELYLGKRVEEKQIRLTNNIEYDFFYELMLKLVEENVIKPVKASKSNGMNPPLYKRYQVINNRKQENFTNEIRLLHPGFNIEGYLQSPNKYLKDREIVQKLNTFLRENSNLLEFSASVNERSFQIFQAEKVICYDSNFKSVLMFNGSLEELLNIYKTPEPFFEYIIDDNPEFNDYNILIIENKDTWYTLRRVIELRNCKNGINGKNDISDKNGSNNLSGTCDRNTFNFITGVKIDCLLYGEGKKITRKVDSLTEYTNTFYDGRKTPTYYYFGDLDYEGIAIFENLIKANKDLKIILMKDLYLDMLNVAGKYKLTNKCKKQSQVEGKLFFSYFNAEKQQEIRNLLEKGYYIPQEILGFEFFLKKDNSFY